MGLLIVAQAWNQRLEKLTSIREAFQARFMTLVPSLLPHLSAPVVPGLNEWGRQIRRPIPLIHNIHSLNVPDLLPGTFCLLRPPSQGRDCAGRRLDVCDRLGSQALFPGYRAFLLSERTLLNTYLFL